MAEVRAAIKSRFDEADPNGQGVPKAKLAAAVCAALSPSLVQKSRGCVEDVTGAIGQDTVTFQELATSFASGGVPGLENLRDAALAKIAASGKTMAEVRAAIKSRFDEADPNGQGVPKAKLAAAVCAALSPSLVQKSR